MAQQSAAVQPKAQSKGPSVWLDMDQQALDDAYDQEKSTPPTGPIVERRIANSERSASILGARCALRYGKRAIETLDVFRCAQPNAPVNVFVHGGAWRRNERPDYAVQAELFVTAPAHIVSFSDFINVDEAGGSLFPMAEQVRHALPGSTATPQALAGTPTLYLIRPFLGIAARRVRASRPTGTRKACRRYVQGRAAAERHVRSQTGKAVEALALRQVHRRDGGGFNAHATSTKLNTPLVLAYGTYETPEFQRQTRDFFGAVQAAGKPVHSSWAPATIISSCSRRWRAPTALPAAPC